jgi:ABC-type antimicrobial peptide transport system permease subunit
MAVGGAAALGLTRLLAGLLFGVGPSDPLTFGGVTALLTAVVLLACAWPAHRAMRVAPTVALRSE